MPAITLKNNCASSKPSDRRTTFNRTTLAASAGLLQEQADYQNAKEVAAGRTPHSLQHHHPDRFVRLMFRPFGCIDVTLIPPRRNVEEWTTN
jgi:hypothetical protein